jgi:hypothetical protein
MRIAMPYSWRVAGVAFVIAIGIGIPYPSGYLARATLRLAHTDAQAHRWIFLHLAELYQLLFALILIQILRRTLRLDFGLRLPKKKSYFMAAAVWGVIAGVVMTLVDYAPQIATHTAPFIPNALTAKYFVGWLSFEGFTAGVSEEVLYRGLLLAVLTASIPARVRFLRYEMNLAGVLLSLIFAAAHVFNFWHRPFWLALGQQGYAFALGVLYAYWREKSGSVIASTIGHNVGNVSEGILSYLMIFMWSR